MSATGNISSFPGSPFDLQKAIAGEPILWKGEPAKFIAYVPEAAEDYQVIVLCLEDNELRAFTADGKDWPEAEVANLTMAPKVQRSVGYRRYFYLVPSSEQLHVFSMGQQNTIAANVSVKKEIERLPEFRGWIDTEWQYHEIELPG